MFDTVIAECKCGRKFYSFDEQDVEKQYWEHKHTLVEIAANQSFLERKEEEEWAEIKERQNYGQ